MSIKMKMFSFFALFFSFLYFASAQTADFACPYGYGMMAGYGTFGLLFGWIFSVLVIIALVLLILWLIKQLQSNGKKTR